MFRVLSYYADEIGVPFATFSGYRYLAIAWPQDKRNPAVSFSVHAALNTHEDRFKLIFNPPEDAEGLMDGRWTLDAALDYAGRKRKTSGPRTSASTVSRRSSETKKTPQPPIPPARQPQPLHQRQAVHLPDSDATPKPTGSLVRWPGRFAG